MSVRLQIKKQHIDGKNNSQVHSVPCKINRTGPANVSKYFTPYITKTDDDYFNASFRGYPLHGKKLYVPEGYKGIVFFEKKKPVNPDLKRTFNSTESFTEFTYWNWDKLPSKNDAFDAALDWVDIAEALHSQVEESS
ncbi:hypothetical protein G9C98_003581 [Cotesia typhae]|uniref:Uncharacterized protein n=1 Tax=Cotesia typhae TaxID=2053667 RepID=A0A8J5VBD5_9HYME|nr:hypothetical protein G9C98_003581 [Cotesia typhae]